MVDPAPSVPTVALEPLRPGDRVRFDGHAHAWIDPPREAPERLDLTDERTLAAGLTAFATATQPRRAGLLDCQPPGAGRDARALARLSQQSGVAIAAVTGFHLSRYYPHGQRPWPDAERAAEAFTRELEHGLAELPGRRAAVIKAGHTGTLGPDAPYWEAVLVARARSDALLLVHTARGAGADELTSYLLGRGVPAARLFLCHVDKRPDHGLHRALASAGVLLGYDTFLRAKYDPEGTTWPLVFAMLDAGHARSLALCLDLAEPSMWPSAVTPAGASGGPSALVQVLEPRLVDHGAAPADVDALLGGNLIERAARPLGTDPAADLASTTDRGRRPQERP